jgi:hypothetical protein
MNYRNALMPSKYAIPGYHPWVDVILDDQRDVNLQDLNMFPEDPENNPLRRW